MAELLGTTLEDDCFTSSLLLDLASEEEGFTEELDSFAFSSDELEFSSFLEEEEDFDFSTDEEDSSLGSGAGAELLDSSPQATNKTAESNNATKYFTEDLQEPQSFFAKFKL